MRPSCGYPVRMAAPAAPVTAAGSRPPSQDRPLEAARRGRGGRARARRRPGARARPRRRLRQRRAGGRRRARPAGRRRGADRRDRAVRPPRHEAVAGDARDPAHAVLARGRLGVRVLHRHDRAEALWGLLVGAPGEEAAAAPPAARPPGRRRDRAVRRRGRRRRSRRRSPSAATCSRRSRRGAGRGPPRSSPGCCSAPPTSPRRPRRCSRRSRSSASPPVCCSGSPARCCPASRCTRSTTRSRWATSPAGPGRSRWSCRRRRGVGPPAPSVRPRARSAARRLTQSIHGGIMSSTAEPSTTATAPAEPPRARRRSTPSVARLGDQAALRQGHGGDGAGHHRRARRLPAAGRSASSSASSRSVFGSRPARSCATAVKSGRGQAQAGFVLGIVAIIGSIINMIVAAAIIAS